MENNAAEAETTVEAVVEPEVLVSTEVDAGPEATETQTPEPQVEEGTETEEPEWFKKRFAKITAQRYEEKARADALEAELQRLRDANPAKPSVAPSIEDFENMGDYNTALATFVSDQVNAGVENKYREIQANTQTAQQETQQKEMVANFRNREAEFAAANPSYYEVAHNPNLPVSEAMAAEIQSSENGPALLLHLANNQQIAQRMSILPASDVAVELGRLELSLGRKPKPKSTTAPPPPSPNSGGSEIIGKDPKDMTTKEYQIWRQGGGG